MLKDPSNPHVLASKVTMVQDWTTKACKDIRDLKDMVTWGLFMRYREWPRVSTSQKAMLLPVDFVRTFMAVYYPITHGEKVISDLTVRMNDKEFWVPFHMVCKSGGHPFQCLEIAGVISSSCPQCAINALLWSALDAVHTIWVEAPDRSPMWDDGRG